jgi:hypothetical protein
MQVSAKPDPDPDPVKWIDVAVDNFPARPAEWLAVNHVRKSEQKVERFDQYNVNSMSKERGYKHWVWTGILRKAPDNCEYSIMDIALNNSASNEYPTRLTTPNFS